MVTSAVEAAGGSVTPIITVGDMLRSGYRFESIPDGISFTAGGRSSKHNDSSGRGNDTIDVYVNHETSRVPFPLAANGVDFNPTTNANGSQNDFDNSQLSKLTLDDESMRVLSASFAIPSSANFQRFCSNFLATREHGFKDPLLFTNEEGIDWVNRSGPAFPAFPGAAGARQIGTVVAYDPQKNKYQPIWGMGRLNHENSVAIPGYGHPVFLTGDDPFTTSPSQSQLYSYIADSGNDVWKDKGDLWAFVSDTPGKQQYDQFGPGDATVARGHFIRVPRLIATGRNKDGSELMAGQVPTSLGGPYPLPPTGLPAPSQWQTFNTVPIDGPQWVLEYWGRQNGVFNFVRLEDMAYDKRPGRSNVVYLVDSGRGTNAAVGTGISSNGRVWEMVLNRRNPTKVDSLRILIEGDDRMVKDPARIHQPDNIESTRNGLYITEDPGSQQNFPFGSIFPGPNFDPNATNARIWQYKFSAPAATRLNVVAVVDQSADEGGTDVDPVLAPGTHGFWEASGIIDVSSFYGPGAFLVTIQSHSLWVQGQNSTDALTRSGGRWSVGPDTYPDWINKREGGQLVLLRIPGG
ncbi:MAG TPA: hypothetical protein VEW45_07395 [Candidatus Dormibacteraeota bacterium]|nr:hypothetical protein [Candidatus Dormibacteraeota bacterium]